MQRRHHDRQLSSSESEDEFETCSEDDEQPEHVRPSGMSAPGENLGLKAEHAVSTSSSMAGQSQQGSNYKTGSFTASSSMAGQSHLTSEGSIKVRLFSTSGAMARQLQPAAGVTSQADGTSQESRSTLTRPVDAPRGTAPTTPYALRPTSDWVDVVKGNQLPGQSLAPNQSLAQCGMRETDLRAFSSVRTIPWPGYAEPPTVACSPPPQPTSLELVPCICELLTQTPDRCCSCLDELQDYVDDCLIWFRKLRKLQLMYDTPSFCECPSHGVMLEAVKQNTCSECTDLVMDFLAIDNNLLAILEKIEGVGRGDSADEAGPSQRQGVTLGREEGFGYEERSASEKGCEEERASRGAEGGTGYDSRERCAGLDGQPTFSVEAGQGGLSSLDKESKKIASKASKKLSKIKKGVQQALQDLSEKRKRFEEKIDLMDASREEADKLLRNHVTHVHTLLDQYHKREASALRRRHKELLQGVLIIETEARNYEAMLVDVQMRVSETLERIHQHGDVTAANDQHVTALKTQLLSCAALNPAMQVQQVKYCVEVPQVTCDDIQCLLGRVVARNVSGQVDASQSGGVSSEPLPAHSSPPTVHQAPYETPRDSSTVHQEPSAVHQKPSAKTLKRMAQKARQRAREEQKRAEEGAKEAQEAPKPRQIVKKKRGRRKFELPAQIEATGVGPTYNGHLWVVYGHENPNLDILDEEGKVVQTKKIGRNAMGAVSFNNDSVLIYCVSPRELKLLDSELNTMWSYPLDISPKGVGVGNTGIVVALNTAVFWIALNGEDNQWIVPREGSTLQKLCSCDVVNLQGREIVCVADSEGQQVCFYEKLESGSFACLPPFSGGNSNPIEPVSISAHAAGFLAVLDASTSSVVIVDMALNNTVSVIAQNNLCSGLPTQIAFALSTGEEDPKLWVGSDSGHVFLVPLKFVY